jgi:hypothetical protein
MSADSSAAAFKPTPFRWRDPATFPRRQFIYGRHYIRRFLSVTAFGSPLLSIAINALLI